MGESAYAIAKSLCESLASLLRLKSWMGNATLVITSLTREMGILDSVPPRPAPVGTSEALLRSLLWPTWPAFTHAFSRTLYPMRFPLTSTHTILTG